VDASLRLSKAVPTTAAFQRAIASEDVLQRRLWGLAGDALRGHTSPAIAPRVISRLREEPTVLAPRRGRSTAKRLGWYGTYAAASLAAVAVVVWTAFPTLYTELAGNAASTAAVSASADPAVENAVVNLPPSAVENYLLAHQPYSHVSAMQGVAPYVRSVAEERRAAGQ
jgi:hypothetical protein